MSIQDVDLFFWGQNRFAAFVSALASPIANPDANLFACLLINAVSFHVFLLLLAYMGTWLVSGTRSLLATAVTFLVLAVTCHLVISPQALHILSLESQPYSMSWSLTLGAFLLWKTGRWWWWVLAALASAPLSASTSRRSSSRRSSPWWSWLAAGSGSAGRCSASCGWAGSWSGRCSRAATAATPGRCPTPTRTTSASASAPSSARRPARSRRCWQLPHPAAGGHRDRLGRCCCSC